MIDEFHKLIRAFLFWILLWVCLTILFFIPFVAGQSITVFVFDVLTQSLIPAGVELIVTSPLSGFLAQMILALILSFIITFPFFLYGVITYLMPALLDRERRAVKMILFPAVFLFFCGCAFAYYFIIPATFVLLYPFATALGASTLFLVGEFIHLVFGIMFAMGVIFLLPIGMVLLSFFGVVPARFWLLNWRYALVFFLMFSAIITPDGTGITMLMLSLPLGGLYALGSMVSIQASKKVLQDS